MATRFRGPRNGKQGIVIFAELKTGYNKPSPDQLLWLEALQGPGGSLSAGTRGLGANRFPLDCPHATGNICYSRRLMARVLETKTNLVTTSVTVDGATLAEARELGINVSHVCREALKIAIKALRSAEPESGVEAMKRDDKIKKANTWPWSLIGQNASLVSATNGPKHRFRTCATGKAESSKPAVVSKRSRRPRHSCRSRTR